MSTPEMSTRETRRQRREAERKAQKLANKHTRAAEHGFVPADLTVASSTDSARAAANRANAADSTGPRTAEGKAKSSQNAFKHGLYSKQLVIADENPADLDRLRADLRAEHQPANTTEEILVNEMAEQYWRLQRSRRLEVLAMISDENFDNWFKLLPLLHRTMAAAERGFHKSLAALQKLQNARGFVPQISAAEPVSEPEIGFVSPISMPPPTSTQPSQPTIIAFVPQNPSAAEKLAA